MTVHTAVRVRKEGQCWVAPCSCGSSWSDASKQTANRLRTKHIRAAALEERRRSKESIS